MDINITQTPASIADAIGRRAIAEALGLGATAVSNAVVRGYFPATWFAVISGLCKQAGVDCPMTCFNMVSPSTADGDALPPSQGHEAHTPKIEG